MPKSKTLQELTDEGLSLYNNMMEQIEKDEKSKKGTRKVYADIIAKWEGQGLFSNRTLKAMKVSGDDLCDFFAEFGLYAQPVAAESIEDGVKETKFVGIIIGKTADDLQTAAQTMIDLAIELGAKHNHTIN